MVTSKFHGPERRYDQHFIKPKFIIDHVLISNNVYVSYFLISGKFCLLNIIRLIHNPSRDFKHVFYVFITSLTKQ